MLRSPLPALLAAAALAVAFAGPAADAAGGGKAKVVLSPGCYLSGGSGTLTGSGFRAHGTWTAKLAGTKQIGTGTIDGKGRIRARFTAPRYHGTSGARQLTLSVTDGPHVASASFLMTPLDASFSPRTGDPASLRVRWRVLGLGKGHGIYVHYLQPNGKLKRTVRIGTARGPCGSLKTGPIALFPFRYAYGTWTFQVDTSAHFSKATIPRLLIGFEIRRPSRGRSRGGTVGGGND
ncbi:MAG TPA: hypothetical protein VFV85_04440 [Conexibacter sp.]|nr:hypothetical protein [Conexibacter sp.]